MSLNTISSWNFWILRATATELTSYQQSHKKPAHAPSHNKKRSTIPGAHHKPVSTNTTSTRVCSIRVWEKCTSSLKKLAWAVVGLGFWRWQTDSVGWGWWEKDRWSGRGRLDLSYLDDTSSRKAKFEPKLFFGGEFSSLKVEQRPWFSAKTFLNYRKRIAERWAGTLKFLRNSRRVAATVGKSCQPCWIIM